MLQSCFWPTYGLSDQLKMGKNIEYADTTKNFLLIKNNFPFDAKKFNQKVDQSFKELFPTNLTSKQSFLNYSPSYFFKVADDEMLEEIKAQVETDYIIFFKTYLIPYYKEMTRTIEFRVDEGDSRTYYLYIDVYDTKTNKRVYSKASISSILMSDTYIISPYTSSTKQLNKTFDKLMSDFRNYIKQKG